MRPQLLQRVLSPDLNLNSYLSTDLVSNKSVDELLDAAWLNISKELNDGHTKPVVLVVGAGAGAPRAHALRDVDLDIFHRVRCIYDVSRLSLSRVNNLIEHCHRAGQPTIVIYVTQPLIKCARDFIDQTVLANSVPSASEFALGHFNALNTFVAVSKHHKKKTSLFAASVISYERAQIHHHSNLRLLKQTNSDLSLYEEEFVRAWKSQRRNGQQYAQEPLFKIKPVHAPRKLRTLNQITAFVSHVLAVTLRSNLRIHFRNDRRKTPSEDMRVASGGGVIGSPAQVLNHARVFGSQEALNKATTRREITAEGQAELLDDERPEQIVVREKLTHPHEMETVKIR